MSDLMEFVRSVCQVTASPATAEPFGTTVDGEPWAVGTDGRCLIAAPTYAVLPVLTGASSLAERMLAEDRPAWIDSDVGTLRQWAGAFESPCPSCHGEKQTVGSCQRCDGAGKVDCSCDCGAARHRKTCDACDGAGTAAEECYRCDGEGIVGRQIIDRVGEHAGVLVNLRLLAWTLRAAPAGPVRIGFGPPHLAVVLHGDGWRGLVMPLDGANRADWCVEPFPMAAAGPGEREREEKLGQLNTFGHLTTGG